MSVAALACAGALALALMALADQRKADMTQLCALQYPELDLDLVDPMDRREVEQIWQADLPADMAILGGVDQRGWARICQSDGAAPDYLHGEYRDRTIWYRGPFSLQAEDGTPASVEALKTHYMSYYDAALGLVLYPIADTAPPVRLLRLVPLDRAGFADLPAPND